jgi:methionine-rich copper-binding protein CopC
VPTISSISPTDGELEVPIGNNLTITFSESVKKGSTGNITIKKLSDNSIVQTIAITDAAVTISGATVTINPSSDLSTDTSYYINIDSGAIKDLFNNSYTGISNTTTWNFTTTDTTAPTLVSTVPPDNGGGASVGANLTATFNEDVVAGSGSIYLYKSSDNSGVEVFGLPDPTR